MRPTLASTAVLSVVVLGIAFFGGWWPQITQMVDDHSSSAKLSVEAANAAAGRLFRVGNNYIDDKFMQFVDYTISRQTTVFIECGPHQSPCDNQDWLTFRLSPRVFVPHPQQAQWAIFYDVDPAQESFAAGWRLSTYSPGFAVARRP